MDAIRKKLAQLYSSEEIESICGGIQYLLEKYRPSPQIRTTLDESDVALICYGDSFQNPDEPGLQTLHSFLQKHLDDTFSLIHILPFYPYSSDDGFSVIDYKAVNPELGNWSDIERLGRSYGLIFDAVINHVSAESDWFREYLDGNPEFDDFFIEIDPEADLSAVTRARAHSLLTTFQRKGREIRLWTTFSADQIDLNFQTPKVLLRMLDVLLFYASKSARILRLDAIGHAWKQPGTSCLNLPQAHALVQIFRAVLDMVFPDVRLLTETNVPHIENIRYFGDGRNEAQLVYQFPLAGLLIHSFYSGSTAKLTRWAQTLELDSEHCTYFNLLASHDGIGVRPLLGILNNAEIELLVEHSIERGGLVSSKDAGNGKRDPYELNITLFDILADPTRNEAENICKFICAHAILLAMQGVPAIYYHSLFGSSGDRNAALSTGQGRAINRKKFDGVQLESELTRPDKRAAIILAEFKRLIAIRKQQPAFNPYARQAIISISDRLFALVRISADGKQTILAVHNLCDEPVCLRIPGGIFSQNVETIQDLTANSVLNINEEIILKPFGFCWLSAGIE